MGVTILFHPTEQRKELIRHVAMTANVPMSEVLRRMIDRCSDPKVLDDLFPHVSGVNWSQR